MITPIDEAIQRLKTGEMLILVDDENRENEGDLVAAAEHVTPETINFMAKHGRGLICMPITAERGAGPGPPADDLGEHRRSTGRPSPSPSTPATGITTGISAADRARTMQVADRPETSPAGRPRPPGPHLPARSPARAAS